MDKADKVIALAQVLIGIMIMIGIPVTVFYLKKWLNKLEKYFIRVDCSHRALIKLNGLGKEYEVLYKKELETLNEENNATNN